MTAPDVHTDDHPTLGDLVEEVRSTRAGLARVRSVFIRTPGTNAMATVVVWEERTAVAERALTAALDLLGATGAATE